MRPTIGLITACCALVFAGCPGQPVALPLPDSSVRDSGATPTENQDPSVVNLAQKTLDANLAERTLMSDLHGGWQILHGVLAYGNDFEIETPVGRRSAVSYLLSGGRIDGFDPRPGNMLGDPPRLGLRMELQPTTKVGQGHRDQWLAVLAQCGLTLDETVRSGTNEFTIGDWLSQMEYDVPLNLEEEFSWTLIVLATYRDTEHSWLARDGGNYRFEDLLQWELEKSLPSSVCGGTHRLIGIASALRRRRQEGKPVVGVWQDAHQRLQAELRRAKENQNPDGTYSVAYHHRTGWNRDLSEALGTTGHVLEFVATAADRETLREPWVDRSVTKLCEILQACREIDLECGVLYHALHGLSEYHRRVVSAEPTAGS